MVRVAGFEPTASWSRSPVGKPKGCFRLHLVLSLTETEGHMSCPLRLFPLDFFCHGSTCGSRGKRRTNIAQGKTKS